jgi:uncharacterized membrane protein YraQ (UPF0718 family)/copper chaperone CopZ
MDITNIIKILESMLNEMSPYILLGFLFAGALHAFVKPSLLSQHFAGNGFKQSLKAALLGVPLPLCSCGVLPTAISLRRSGASTSATTSFLIATPQTGVDSIAATYSLLGLGFAIVRPIASFLSAVLGGTIMGKLTKDDEAKTKGDCELTSDLQPTLFGKIKDMLHYGFVDMVSSVGKWLVIGLVIAALITALIPDDFFVRFAEYPILAMIIVVIIAVPMYVCATGSIPIALSLMLKGLTPGVAFVFLMAGPAVNFASYTLLSRTMGKRNTLLYIAIIALSAIGVGLVIDYLLPSSWFVPRISSAHACCEHGSTWFDSLCSIILCALLIYAFVIKRLINKQKQINMAKEYIIDGMMCAHCQARVEKGLATLDGVTSVTVDLGKKTAKVEGNVSEEAIKAKVSELGYDYAGLKG